MPRGLLENFFHIRDEIEKWRSQSGALALNMTSALEISKYVPIVRPKRENGIGFVRSQDLQDVNMEDVEICKMSKFVKLGEMGPDGPKFIPNSPNNAHKCA